MSYRFSACPSVVPGVVVHHLPYIRPSPHLLRRAATFDRGAVLILNDDALLRHQVDCCGDGAEVPTRDVRDLPRRSGEAVEDGLPGGRSGWELGALGGGDAFGFHGVGPFSASRAIARAS